MLPINGDCRWDPFEIWNEFKKGSSDSEVIKDSMKIKSYVSGNVKDGLLNFGWVITPLKIPLILDN